MTSPEPELRVGAAYRNITPAYPVWQYGYSSRDRKSDGLSEPIYLGCLNLTTPEKTLLIITCDLLGIESDVCEELYQLIETETGIGYPDILISCSHTHFAPGMSTATLNSPNIGVVEPDPRFVEDFKIKLIEAVRDSLRNTRSVALETTRVMAPQILFNRRTVLPDGSVQTNFLYPEDAENYSFGRTDAEITALRFADDTGVQAALVNFGCHPVTGGDNHYAISSDYPYYLRKKLSEHYGCPVFFTLGAAGDTVPINRYGDSRRRIGELLANSIILAERTFKRQTPVELTSDLISITARTMLETHPVEARERFDAARDELLALEDSPDTDRSNGTYRNSTQCFNQTLIAMHRTMLYPENSFDINIQSLKIGPTQLVAFPFEVLSEISLKLKEQNPDSALVSISGGYQGYLPLNYEYMRGGYEASAWSTHFESDTADRLLDTVLQNPFFKMK